MLNIYKVSLFHQECNLIIEHYCILFFLYPRKTNVINLHAIHVLKQFAVIRNECFVMGRQAGSDIFVYLNVKKYLEILWCYLDNIEKNIRRKKNRNCKNEKENKNNFRK